MIAEHRWWVPHLEPLLGDREPRPEAANRAVRVVPSLDDHVARAEVLASRIGSEYGVPISFESVGYEMARWVRADDKVELKRFVDGNKSVLAEDKDGEPIYLAQSSWYLQRMQKDWPKVQFFATKERA